MNKFSFGPGLSWVIFFFIGTTVSGLHRSYLYPHGRGVPDKILPPQDDVSSPELVLKTPIVFYDDIYHSVFINSNGLISFITELSAFFNIQFPLDYPVIAPLYTNVDVRATGSVYYRESQEAEILERATANVKKAFSYAQDFEAKSALIVTWEDVGYHNQGADKVNTFQAIVITNEYDSYVEFLYPEDGIQWIKGTGSSSSLPDALAQAGFVSADGRMATLKGSGTDQISHLNQWSNVGNPGQWLFHIGKVGPDGNASPPDVHSEEEEEIPKTCTSGVFYCHSQAMCDDYATGFCCACKPGFYGNGISCLSEDMPVRVNGKVSGLINGVNITDVVLQAYVVPKDGRSYTALSKVPMNIGYDMQSLNILGTTIGWLFAKPVKGASNGYQLTGGVFNQTVTVTYPQTGHQLTLRQRFTGLDVFEQLTMTAEIKGDIPNIPIGSKITIKDYDEQYTRIGPGQLLGHSSQVFQLEGVEIDNVFTVEQNIRYHECEHSATPVHPFRLKVARNYIGYEAENIIRYAMNNKVTPIGIDEDPCKEGQNQCGRHSTCIAEGDTFRCICNPGYTHMVSNETENGCADADECVTGTHNCDVNAVCINNQGSFYCQCNSGFTGDGVTCIKDMTCEDIQCDVNAYCIQRARNMPQCFCKQGFHGNGTYCVSMDHSGGESGSEYRPEYPYPTIHESSPEYRPEYRPDYTGRENQDGGQDYRPNYPTGNQDYKHDYPSGGADYRPEYPSGGHEHHPSYPSGGSDHRPDYRPEGQDYRPDYPSGSSDYRPDYPSGGPEHRPSHPEGSDYRPNYPTGSQDYRPNYPTGSQDYRPDYPTGNHDYRPDYTSGGQEHRPSHPEGSDYRPDYPTGSQDYRPDYKPDHRGGGQDYRPDYPSGSSDYRPEYPSRPQEHRPDYPEGPDYRPDYRPEYRPGNQDYRPDYPSGSYDYRPNYSSGGQEHRPDYPTGGHDGQSYYPEHRTNYGSDNTELDLSRPQPICYLPEKCSCPKNYKYNLVTDKCDPESSSNGTLLETKGASGFQIPCDVLNRCHPHAQCLPTSPNGNYRCECSPGYQGDGIECVPANGHLPFEGDECLAPLDCVGDADCIYDPQLRRNTCICFKGFYKDPISRICVRDHSEDSMGDSCLVLNDCHEKASCIMRENGRRPECVCNPGYEGDGRVECRKSQRSCHVTFNCAPGAADCVYDNNVGDFRCRCRQGYEGDGLTCSPIMTCAENASICGEHASCMPSHIGGYSCSCDRGYVGNGKICKPEPEKAGNFLLLNQGNTMMKVPFNPTNQDPAKPIMMQYLQQSIGIDVDCTENRVYWSDIAGKKIESATYMGTDVKKFITDDIQSVEGLAIDWMSRNVYWTDSKKDTIEVANLENPKLRKVLITGGLVNPRGIAVHPTRGKVFWSDWNRAAPKIEWANLDGSNRAVFLEGPSVQLPNSLAVDSVTDEVCWADAGTKSIECTGIANRYSRTVTQNCSYPFGLAISDDYYYWTDWTTRKVERIGRHSQFLDKPLSVPIVGSAKLYGIVAVPDFCPRISNICQHDYGRCSDNHLCLPDGAGGRTCACGLESC